MAEIKEVTKAVIPAAGLGSRMYPFTKVESKLMIQIINKPVIEYLVEELVASGIEEIIIVSSHIAQIKEFFKKNEGLNELLKRLRKEKSLKKLRYVENLAKMDYISQDTPLGWMHEVLQAKKYVKKEPFVVCFSDVLYKSKMPAAKQVISLFQKTGMNIYSNGRFVFKPPVFNILEREDFKLGETIADDVLDELKQNKDLEIFDIEGVFFDVGDPLSYLKTETTFALDNPEIGKEYRKFLNQLLSK